MTTTTTTQALAKVQNVSDLQALLSTNHRLHLAHSILTHYLRWIESNRTAQRTKANTVNRAEFDGMTKAVTALGMAQTPFTVEHACIQAVRGQAEPRPAWSSMGGSGALHRWDLSAALMLAASLGWGIDL